MSTKANRLAEILRPDQKKGKKASTNELPMVDLESVLGFVDKIEGDGLQTLPQQEVAKRLGYATKTSTPFYRRMAAARLFGLIDTTQGVNLTKLALDYFKPLDEESKKQALSTAVNNVIGYKGLIERFSGKRLPPSDILRNSFEREFDLATEAANICTDVFVRSVKGAGLVKSDGTLGFASVEASPVRTNAERPVQASSITLPPVPATSSDESESHYLTLDARRSRRVMIQAPPIITGAELKRIQSWLAVQLHVVESFELDDGDQSTNDNNNSGTTGES
jgi:hypothetical protein